MKARYQTLQRTLHCCCFYCFSLPFIGDNNVNEIGHGQHAAVGLPGGVPERRRSLAVRHERVEGLPGLEARVEGDHLTARRHQVVACVLYV